MGRVIHFELPADNPERAARFYEEIFGWKVEKWGGPTDYWLLSTGDERKPGINGAIMRRQKPFLTTTNSVEVESIDDFAGKVEQKGGQVLLPKMPIPGVGYIAYCQDTGGNSFGLFQPDTSVSTRYNF